MATVTSINAFPPRPPNGGRRGTLLSQPDDGGRIGAIMSVPAPTIVEALGLACAAGMAVMFSPTSDGGALGVHVFVGSDRDKLYATSAEQFAHILEAIRDLAESRMAGHTALGAKVAQRAPERT